MAMLYQFKLEYDAQCKQDQILTCTPAYMALVSVTSMVHDIARARLPINGPVIFPGIISLYHVAKATSSLHHLRLDSGIVVNNIVDTLRALTHRSKLAGKKYTRFDFQFDTLSSYCISGIYVERL